MYIWKFSVHILLKPSLKDYEHHLASMWNKCNCVVVWTFFGVALLWDWNENWPFPVLWPPLSFPYLLAYECSTFTASFFKIWNSSAGISSPPLGLFIVMLPKAHFTSQSRMPGSGWVIKPSWLSEFSWFFFLEKYKWPPISPELHICFYLAVMFKNNWTIYRSLTFI